MCVANAQQLPFLNQSIMAITNYTNCIHANTTPWGPKVSSLRVQVLGAKKRSEAKLTGEDAPSERPQDAHEHDGDGHEACHLVLAQGEEGQQGRRQVEHQRGDGGPQEHAVPHLCQSTGRKEGGRRERGRGVERGSMKVKGKREEWGE